MKKAAGIILVIAIVAAVGIPLYLFLPEDLFLDGDGNGNGDGDDNGDGNGTTPGPNTDSTLSALSIFPGDFGTFYPTSTYYSADVPFGTTSVSVSATTNDPSASVRIGSGTSSTGSLTEAVALDAGGTTIEVIVTAEDGTTTKTYEIYISIEGPPTPSGVSASDGTSGTQISVTWSSVAGATAYKVYRKKAIYSSYGEITEVSETSYDDTSVDPGKLYDYAITSLFDSTESEKSASDSGYASYYYTEQGDHYDHLIIPPTGNYNPYHAEDVSTYFDVRERGTVSGTYHGACTQYNAYLYQDEDVDFYEINLLRGEDITVTVTQKDAPYDPYFLNFRINIYMKYKKSTGSYDYGMVPWDNVYGNTYEYDDAYCGGCGISYMDDFTVYVVVTQNWEGGDYTFTYEITH